MNDKNEIRNKKSDPGASKHGNFINYYKFHPADERLQQLPRGIWKSSFQDEKYITLDIGCNAGDLTFGLYNFLTAEQSDEVSILGIDLDPILVDRANEQHSQSKNLLFQCLDFFAENREDQLKHFLQSHNRTLFDVVFAFSITMWIHLNHGDLGLKKFLQTICEMSNIIVVEPQLWKCYRQASRRMRRAKQGDFPMLETLNYRGNVQEHIENILENDCLFRKVSVSEANEWQRKLLIYERTR